MIRFTCSQFLLKVFTRVNIFVQLFLRIICVRAIDNSECLALQSFYTSTNGDQWFNNVGWPSSPINPNITCNDICNPVVPFGTFCSESNHIEALSFQTNNLYGTIPLSISNFSYLNILSFFKEWGLNGTLPDTIYNMKTLSSFQIQYTGIGVQISNSLCNLTGMQSFDIEHNLYANGTIPDCIGNLKKLQDFAVTSVNISYDNQDGLYLTGTIPTALVNLPLIRTVMISNQRLSGPLPKYIRKSDLWLSFEVDGDANKLDSSYQGLYGTIPPSFCNFTCGISLRGHALYGSIPDCIFNNVGSAVNGTMYIPPIQVDFSQNQLSGTIPTPFWYKHGTFEDGYGCNNSILSFGSNNLNGTIPEWITQCYDVIAEFNDNKLIGSIHSNWTGFKSLVINNNQLSGTIPSDLTQNICRTLDNALSARIDIFWRNNEFSGSFPANLINDFNNCTPSNVLTSLYVDLSNNKFDYFPFCEIHNDKLAWLVLSNNKIQNNNIGKSLQCLLTNNSNLEQIYLHNNHKIKGDINSGNLNLIQNHSNFDKLEYLTMHDCDIGGSLPNKMDLSQMIVFTLFNNHISCKLPNRVTPYQGEESTHEFVLLGNLFDYNKGRAHSQWLQNSSFIDATNLYLTKDDIMELYFLLIVAALTGIIVLCLICVRLWQYCSRILNIRQVGHHHWYNYHEFVNIQQHPFLQIVRKTWLSLNDPIIILPSIVLCVVYFMNSNYYSCGRITSHFSFAYFEYDDLNNNNDNDNEFGDDDDDQTKLYKSICEILIIVCAAVINGEFLHRLIIIQDLECLQRDESQSMWKRRSIQSVNQSVNQSANQSVEEFDESNTSKSKTKKARMTASKSNTVAQIKRKMKTRMPVRNGYPHKKPQIKCGDCLFAIIKCIFWFVLYLFGLCFTSLYIIVQSLPSNNILNIDDYYQEKMIDYILGIVIGLTNIYVVPGCIESICDIIRIISYGITQRELLKRTRNRALTSQEKKEYDYSKGIQYWVILLRSMNSIIIPLIVSFLFLNDCGKMWALLWKPCIDDSDSFDINIENPVQGTGVTHILTHRSVCGNGDDRFSLTQFEFGHCLRSFYDHWIPIILIKLFVVMINPWILIVINYSKHSLQRRCNCGDDSGGENNNNNNRKRYNYKYKYIASNVSNVSNPSHSPIANLSNSLIRESRIEGKVHSSPVAKPLHSSLIAGSQESINTSENINNTTEESDHDTDEKHDILSTRQEILADKIYINEKKEQQKNEIEYSAQQSPENANLLNVVNDDCDVLTSESKIASIDPHASGFNVMIKCSYAMIATKLEICLFFGLIAPYVLWMTCIAVLSNYLAFRKMYENLKWNFSPSTITFPVYSILVALLLQQVIFGIFCWNVFGYGATAWIILSVFIDGVYAYLVYQAARGRKVRVSSILTF